LIAICLPGAFHGRDHPARVGGGGGEGFFHEDVDAMGGEAFDIIRVVGGGGAEDRHVVGAGRHAGVEIGEEAVGRDAELARDGLHFRHVRVVEARDLRLRVVMHEAQEIAHVHVVETDADDAELRHVFLPQPKNQRCSVNLT
jgi:hypothetical protein